MEYVYFISSLPMLQFDAKPPFSFEIFLLKAADFISIEELEILRRLSDENIDSLKHPLIESWQSFNVSLRNELVKLRAVRKKVDPHKYLRPGGEVSSALAHTASNAQRNPSVLEAEKILDREKWNFLDELSFGHYFDFEFLIIYGYKLLILERWEKLMQQDSHKIIEDLLMNN
ncbi:MAG: DUF2764 family protein [Candidatus Omnitrophica bacterium]|nr:DUF2764 family protein [Candidatus Omnitrophota bacterium]